MELGEEQEIPDERVPCQFCNRKFSPSSLLKHAVVCEKTSHKKRKTFDSAKQRIQGTELAEFLPVAVPKKNETSSNQQPKEKPIPVTRRVIDTTHNVPSRKHSSKIASPFTKSSNYERCPYCDRSFGPKAFDRHIEWCKEQSIRINSKSTATQEAKERLEARIKYRAPSFKSRRSITKEKYSSKPNSQDSRRSSVKSEEQFEAEVKSTKSYESGVKIKASEKSKPKDKEVNFIRQNVLRCSYKPKTSKKAESKTEKDNNNLQNKRATDFADIQDWISVNGTKMKQFPQSSKSCPGDSSLTSSMYDDYDPYLLAEHQMKELFSDNHSSDEHLNLTYTVKRPANPSSHSKEERRNKCQNKENISSPVKTISCQTDGAEKGRSFKTSPTSAFNKYSSNGSSERVNRAPTPVPDEFNFLPPITNNVARREASNQAPHDAHSINRYPLISLSNLSLCSSVSIDIPEENRKLGNCKSAEVRNDVEPFLLKRSISASNDKQNKNTIKKNLRMENLLYGNEDQKDPNTTYTTDPFLNEYDQKLEKINSLLDGEGFDLMNSFTEFENVLQNSYYDNDTYTAGSDSPPEKPIGKRERGDSMASKLSVDSAYNSLNRKSPTIFGSQQLNGKTSTPETDALKSSTLSLSGDFNDTIPQSQQKLSKFCHECGAKFPLAIAKFCCECGVRRLVI